MLILITGGARSGKSSFAERYAARLGSQGAYIATAQAYDDEMRERIGLHRRQREDGSFRWSTVEEPFELAQVLSLWGTGPFADAPESRESAAITAEQPSLEPSGDFQTETQVLESIGASMTDSDVVVLVDCLTLWLTNWLLRWEQEADVEKRLMDKIEELTAACRQYTDSGRHLLLVTNEVGYGLVPEYKLGRQFRDVSGWMNQRLAREAEQVFLVTSGIPLELKSLQFRWSGQGAGLED